ncbi:hypothetical protein [Actinokineospora globicatena]|uniref:DUF3800 domain-containing protein n=1 Tax=Actinokineospora globicatena TaxID=103729 RepID=A0A9W6QS97_9PSEU|nr:hypothetical protein [Actinokineospora globicatena]GLW94662.1 hypothetical protein Aglo03_54780 [Actinokineospora globicatena]
MDPTPQRIAYVDETSAKTGTGTRLYGLATVLTEARHHQVIAAEMATVLPPGRDYLHHYDETPVRRAAIAKVIANLPLDGAIVLTEVASSQQQERARTRLLAHLLPRLQHDEGVEQVFLESRSGADKHDRRTRERLRSSRRISTDFRVDHIAKSATALIWLPDFVAGAYIAARFHGEAEPWEMITTGHVVDVISL